MNTKNKQEQKKRGRKTGQEQRSKKLVRNPVAQQDHEQEHPETRMTR
jgi:hypothetical protein